MTFIPILAILTTCNLFSYNKGINLAAADVCILFDSDWNPQNDIQAQSRCHRIGQTKSVKVYRLLTRKTYEQFMFNMSSLKMGLDKAVLNGVESSNEVRNHEVVYTYVSLNIYSSIIN